MKAVMMSRKPKETQRILSGEQTYIILKNKLPLNKTVFVYMTKINKTKNFYTLTEDGLILPNNNSKRADGKVVAKIEFDKIELIGLFRNFDEEKEYYITKEQLKNACITEKELNDYGKFRPLYFHHISKVEIIEPMEIGEFIPYVDADFFVSLNNKIVFKNNDFKKCVEYVIKQKPTITGYYAGEHIDTVDKFWEYFDQHEGLYACCDEIDKDYEIIQTFYNYEHYCTLSKAPQSYCFVEVKE